MFAPYLVAYLLYTMTQAFDTAVLHSLRLIVSKLRVKLLIELRVGNGPHGARCAHSCVQSSQDRKGTYADAADQHPSDAVRNVDDSSPALLQEQR